METQPATPTRAAPGVQPPGHDRGLVTLLFSDVVGSTALKQALGDRGGVALLQQHHEQVRQVLRDFAGAEVIKTAGDSFLILFPMPSEAVRCALLLQGRLRQFNEGLAVAVQDRLGLHIGEVVIEEIAPGQRDVHGIQVDTCSRVMGLAQGGQILMTRGVFDSARQMLKGEDIAGVGALNWVSHGRYLLKGVEEPVEICEVAEAGRSPLRPPDTTEKAQRHTSPDEEPVLGWRPAVGTVVPNTKWVLEQKLGEGGFGEVWLGRHQVMKERRVFKFCFRADRVRSLKREMTLFRLIKERIGDHPHIVSLREVYFDQPPFYVEMDYVAGQDLRAWCEQQGGLEKVPLAARLEIVAQIADALQAAHDAGVIHRDVKPGNILVSQLSALNAQPAAKLTDFGIGQVVSEEALKGVTKAGFTQTIVADSSSSQTGSQMYMAAELLAGKPASIRSDIYSLGVVLYQLLVGDFRRPVTTDWGKEISEPLLREDLRHCFAGNPQERFAGAGQLAKNLRSLPERQRVLARQQAELAARERAAYRRGMLRTAGVALLVVAVVALLAVYAFTQARRADRNAKAATQHAREAAAAAQALRHSLYLADINAAQLALQENNIGRAVELVNKYFPKPGEQDLRGIEWRYLWNRCQGDESFALDFHGYPVNAASCSPDGKLVALASFDNKVTVVDMASKKVLTRLDGFFKNINNQTVAFSPDGKLLAAADRDALNLWRTDTWGLSSRLEGESLVGKVIAVAFSPDGKTVTTACAGKLAFWDSATVHPRALVRLAPPFSYGHRLAYSPDGRTLAVAAADEIQLWDVGSGSWTERFAGRLNSIMSLAWSSHWLAAGSWSGDLKMWDMRTGREILNLKPHPTFTFALAFSPDGKTLATGGGDQKIHLWDVAALDRELAAPSTGNVPPQLPKAATLQGHRHEVWAVAYSLDGQALVTGGKDGSARFWDRLRPRETTGLEGARVPLRFSPDGRSLLALGADLTLAEWDVLSRQKTRAIDLSLNTNEVLSVAMAPDGRILAVGKTNGTVELVNLEQRQRFARQKFGDEPVIGLGFSPRGNLLVVQILQSVSGAQSSQLVVWNPASGETFGPFENVAFGPFENVASAFACTPDERKLACGTPGYELRIWDFRTAKPLVTLRRHTWWILGASFSPDGKLLVTASVDNTLRLWDTASWSELAILRGHMGGVRCAAFSADGKTLASGSADGAIKLWDVVTRQELLSFGIAPDYPLGVMLSPDKSAIAIRTGLWAGRRGGVLLLRAPTFAEIEPREKANAAARAVVKLEN